MPCKYFLSVHSLSLLSCCSSITKSYPILRPHGLQRTSLLCPSLSSGVCSNSYPLSRWHYLTISSSAILFPFCLQSFSAAGSFPLSWLLASDDQNIGASGSESVLLMNIQGWFPLVDWFDLQGTLKSLLQHHNSKASIFLYY